MLPYFRVSFKAIQADNLHQSNIFEEFLLSIYSSFTVSKDSDKMIIFMSFHF